MGMLGPTTRTVEFSSEMPTTWRVPSPRKRRGGVWLVSQVRLYPPGREHPAVMPNGYGTITSPQMVVQFPYSPTGGPCWPTAAESCCDGDASAAAASISSSFHVTVIVALRRSRMVQTVWPTVTGMLLLATFQQLITL